MESEIDKRPIHALGILVLFSLTFILQSYSLNAFAATSFGIDYRHLTTVSPGGTPDTTTTIAVGSGATGTFIVNPHTSGSTATGTPSTTSLSGYGWRTAGVVGSSIPAGTWSITVTTQSSLTSVLGNGNVKVFAYSTDSLGSNLVSMGSATGTNNVFAVLVAQTETITFSAASVDLTNRVLVVEYWIDVTTGPLLATTITFQASSSTQTVVLPSSSGTFYLANPSLFSIGESESAAVSDALSRSMTLTRAVSDSPITLDSSSRAIATSRAVAESSGASVTDFVSNVKGFMREISEASGAAITDGISSAPIYSRQVSEISSALVTDGTTRMAGYARQVSETSGVVVSDSISKFIGYARQVSEASGALVTDSTSRAAMFSREISETSALISDLLSAIFGDFTPPPEDEDRGRRGGGGGGRGVVIHNEPPLVETPPIEDETAVESRHLEVRVSDAIGIHTEEKTSLTPIGLNVTISASLDRIATSLQPIPPSAIGSVMFEITNNVGNTEYVNFQYWVIDERTGLRLVEGTEVITLSPYQSVSKELDITFISPGEYLLEASIPRNDGDVRGMTSMQIAVSWIAVYLRLLITIILGAIAGIVTFVSLRTFRKYQRLKRSEF